MKPQDVLVLLRIVKEGEQQLTQTQLARALFMSQSEVSQSIARLKYAGLLYGTDQVVRKDLFLEFLQYGLAVVFPARPGAITRGIPTAHSASPLQVEFASEDLYVWPWAKGESRGKGIPPLYSSVPQAAFVDPEFHEWLALVDALRVGRTRERNLALQHLKSRLKIE